MIDTLRLHQQLYNAALQQRREAWSRQRVSVGFAAQCRELTALRREDKTFATMNAQSAQVTLKRLDLAFQSRRSSASAAGGTRPTATAGGSCPTIGGGTVSFACRASGS